MRYPIMRLSLLLLLVPLLMSCSIEPQDKWPVITDWTVTPGNLNVELVGPPDYALPHIIVPEPQLKLEVTVRTYNANQTFTARVMIERIRREFWLIDPLTGALLADGEEDYPFDYFTTPVDEPVDFPHGDPTEPIVWDGLKGEYVSGSGEPPWGETKISFFVRPNWFPIWKQDWLDYDPHYQLNKETNRYMYLFKVIMEDSGGRTDTFSFELHSII